MVGKSSYIALFCIGLHMMAWSQEAVNVVPLAKTYLVAHQLAFDGDIGAAKGILANLDNTDRQATSLLGRIDSWEGRYDDARKRFNKITSIEKKNAEVWTAAVKNELYAKNDATALGLANKALLYLKGNAELERLRDLALWNVNHQKYPEMLPDEPIKIRAKKSNQEENAISNDVGAKSILTEPENSPTETSVVKTENESEGNNRIGITNSFTMYDAVYDPMYYSSISYRRKTLAGSIIPRVNYSNRLNNHGVQYEFDFYPKFSKRFYAYLNYGYSNASIYPNHKVGGDLYANLPGAIEFSAGMRYISFDTKDVAVITNSLGHYRGNYYFSLRSYITPQANNLTRISGNLLVRKYLRDAENFFGINVGMGYSPELRQLRNGDELLAETLLYIESQRISAQYQFTPKKHPNIYMVNLGVARQELAYDTGNFFWAVSAGISYNIKF